MTKNEAPPDSVSDGRVARRTRRHRELAGQLERLTDADLVQRLSDSEVSTRGHATIVWPGDAPIFVKLVAVTALELQPQHIHATANIFNLPTFYQYPRGSAGFGAWRELEIHRCANDWVLSGACPAFPLLHHWRILPVVNRGEDGKLGLEPWGDDLAIRHRLSSIAQATSSVVLFLEHFPYSLGDWFGEHEDDRAHMAAVMRSEATLLETVTFMHDQGVLHFDVHAQNVVTDGHELFLGDFGLATSRTFDLDADERVFFEQHGNFDQCMAVTSLVHAVVTRYDAQGNWRESLREMAEGACPQLPPAARAYLERRSPVAIALGDHYRRLAADLRAPYPAAMQGLLDGMG